MYTTLTIPIPMLRGGKILAKVTAEPVFAIEGDMETKDIAYIDILRIEWLSGGLIKKEHVSSMEAVETAWWKRSRELYNESVEATYDIED